MKMNSESLLVTLWLRRYTADTVLMCTGVPAVTKFQYTLLSRFPVDCVLREMVSALQNLTPDSNISVFRSQDAVKTPSAEVVYARYVPLHPSASVSVCGLCMHSCQFCQHCRNSEVTNFNPNFLKCLVQKKFSVYHSSFPDLLF